MNIRKRIISGVMAGVLALSMAVPAFATNNTTVVTGTYQPPTIAVEIPGNTTAAINPYGMPVDLKNGDDKIGSISDQQVATQPIYVINMSEVPLAVGATVTTTVKGGLTLVSDAEKVTGKTKASFVYLQMKQTMGYTHDNLMAIEFNDAKDKVTKYAFSWDKDKTADYKFAGEFGKWEDGYKAGRDLVLTTSDTGAKMPDDKPMMVLAAATKVDAASGTNPEYYAVASGGVGIVRISGKLSESPTEAWTASDGFTAKIAFTFKPASTKLEITNSTENKVVKGSTATFKVVIPDGITVNETGITWSNADADDKAIKITSGGTTEEVTVTGVDAGTDTLSVTFKGTNNITYKGSVVVTCTAS